MADEKEPESTPEVIKPVKKVKKVLEAEAPAAAPKAEAPAAPKPVVRAAAKPTVRAAAKAPAPAKKPTSKSAAAPKPAAKPAPKPEEKKPEPEKPAVEKKKEPAPERKRPAKEKPAKKPEKAPAKKAEKKPAKKEKEAEEEAEEEEEHEARKKPELADSIRAALRIRLEAARRRPTFYRQEWFRHPRLGLKWHKPDGGQSKLRRHLGYRINVVSIGFRGPKPARGLHPSGFQEVLVHNVKELEGLDPKRQAVRIAGGVGGRKREQIQEEADDKGLRVLNRREA